jgi:hypothetical protein
MKTGQADGVEHPHGGLGNPAERRPDGAQPAEDQAHDQGTAAGGERDRQPAGHRREQPDQPGA